MSELFNQIKKAKSNVFRRAKIKRRSVETGQFESDWYDISADVKSYGKVVSSVDAERAYKFTFGNVKLVVNNDSGRYNPSDDETSLWYNYLNQQRTLVKLEAGFYSYANAGSHWHVAEVPSETLWDLSVWDADAAEWDQTIPSTVFVGVISGDIVLSDRSEVTFNVKPLVSIFQEFPAKALTGWTSTGMTASQFVTMLRDQTDGSGSFIFRPFFENTTSYWDISATSVVYANLNTSTANDVYTKNVWEVIEKLAEAENYVPYITRSGTFKFVSRAANTSVTSFEFHGAGSYDGTYGQTIKSVKSFGPKYSRYYSRVQVKWQAADTTTSYEIIEATFTVSSVSNPWVLGHRTLEIENLYIQSASIASSIAQTIFNDVSVLKNEVNFTTSFIPGLDLFDRFAVYYDPSVANANSLWDQNNWATENTSTILDLEFDAARGDSVTIEGDEFKFLSFEIDLDNMENNFVAREV